VPQTGPETALATIFNYILMPRGIASPGLPKIRPISKPAVRSIGYRVINTST
jgi:hypothetical protein